MQSSIAAASFAAAARSVAVRLPGTEHTDPRTRLRPSTLPTGSEDAAGLFVLLPVEHEGTDVYGLVPSLLVEVTPLNRPSASKRAESVIASITTSTVWTCRSGSQGSP